MNTFPDNIQGSYIYPNASQTNPIVGIAPHSQDVISESPAYPHPRNILPPPPMNPSQPYVTPIQAHQIQTTEPSLHHIRATAQSSIGTLTNFIYGPNPQLIVCQYCSKEMTTVTKKSTSATIWCGCISCFFVGCVAGCCLIPFLLPKNYNYTHSCSNCGKEIGKYLAYKTLI